MEDERSKLGYQRYIILHDSDGVKYTVHFGGSGEENWYIISYKCNENELLGGKKNGMI